MGWGKQSMASVFAKHDRKQADIKAEKERLERVAAPKKVSAEDDFDLIDEDDI